jgi:hypothetical protein
MDWPKVPTCHRIPAVFLPSEHELTWRPSTAEREHRTCSYCGSAHPQDLLVILEAGGTLGGSDWKYGWPHKFYVKGSKGEHLGKFYAEHIEDEGYSDDALRTLLEQIEKHAGIVFRINEGELEYSAPYHGYQR